ncbi:MAG: hypothetical protein ABEJ08_00730 [Halobacteriaceae archaeon]
MPSTSESLTLPGWMTTQRNLTIFVAILVAVPIAYGFRMAVGGTDSGSTFLLLMTLAVGVPTAYDEYWPHYDQTSDAVVWVVTACLVVTTEFTGLYLLGTELGDLSPRLAAIGAFLITDLGNLAALAVRDRRRHSDA